MSCIGIAFDLFALDSFGKNEKSAGFSYKIRKIIKIYCEKFFV